MANSLSVTFGLGQPLAAFIQASSDMNVLLWMVYAGLAVAGIVTLLLAARMIAARRSAELALRRARGASLWQLFWLGTRGAAVACVPAAVLAWALAVLLVPGAAPPGPAAWWPGIATLAVAATGPGVTAAWQHRLPRRRRRHAAALALAAQGGLRGHRLRRGHRRASRSCGRRRAHPTCTRARPRCSSRFRRSSWPCGCTSCCFAGWRGHRPGSAASSGSLASAARRRPPLTLALPAMTLVLALTVAAFTGMVRAAVVRDEIAVSWQATGADVVLTAPGQLGMSPAAVRAISRGVQASGMRPRSARFR